MDNARIRKAQIADADSLALCIDAAYAQYADRLPDYHRLDVRFTYTGTWVGRPLEFYIDLINIYRRKNVLYYRNVIEVEEIEGFGQSERTARPVLFREPVFMLPFVPSLGFRVKL